MPSDPDPEAAAPLPHQRIGPAPKLYQIGAAEVWAYRDLLRLMSTREVRLRYRQTVLGASWVVIQPLVSASVVAFVFGRVAKLSADGVPYFAFVFAGMLAWNLFSVMLTRAGASLLGNAPLVAKIYFPRLILPLSVLLTCLVDFAVGLVFFLVILLVSGVSIGPAALTLPVWLVLLAALTMGIGLLAASLVVTYRDVQNILPLVTQVLFYASPIAYSRSNVPTRFQPVYKLNPLVGTMEAFRWSMLGTPFPDWGTMTYVCTVSVVLLVAGLIVFKSREDRFADVI